MELNDKINTFLKALKDGYSRHKAFKMSEMSFLEWQKAFTSELEEEMIKLEQDYQEFLEEAKDSHASLVYSPILDNYAIIDFKDKELVKEYVFQTVMYQAITNPHNPAFAKNAIQLMKDENSKNSDSKEQQITYVTYQDFVKKAGYPQPYQPQLGMVEFANKPGIKQILAARKYGKTDYLTILNVAYKIKTIPNYTCMIVTKEESRGKAICGAIKTACIENGVEFDIKMANQLRKKGHFGKEHSVITVPVGGTGYRGHHVDEIILDDPVVPSDKTSPANRQRVIDLYNELVNLSKNILVIGQPVHKNDLYSVLRESSMCEAGEVQLLELPHGSIPELDTDLVRLRNNGVSEDAIGANYLLKLRSEGTLPFNEVNISPNDDLFNPLNENRKKYNVEMWIDPSKRVSGRDYTAISLNMITDDYIYSLGFAFDKPWSDCLAEILYLQTIYEPRRVMFELNGLGDDSIIRLKEWGIRAIPFDTKENKEKKITSMHLIAADIILCTYKEVEETNFIVNPKTHEKQDVYLIAPNKLFNRLFKDYEYGLPDDAVDTTASFLLAKGIIKVKI